MSSWHNIVYISEGNQNQKVGDKEGVTHGSLGIGEKLLRLGDERGLPLPAATAETQPISEAIGPSLAVLLDTYSFIPAGGHAVVVLGGDAERVARDWESGQDGECDGEGVGGGEGEE